MALKVGSDVARRSRRYRARQYVSDYEVPAAQDCFLSGLSQTVHATFVYVSDEPPLPINGCWLFVPLRDEIEAVTRGQFRPED